MNGEHSLTDELNSDDPNIQDDAIRKLEELGTDHAIATLAGCLDHNKWRQAKGFDPERRGPNGELPQGRLIYEPLSYMALRSLSRMISGAPTVPMDRPLSDEDVINWKSWWSENKNSFVKKNLSL